MRGKLTEACIPKRQGDATRTTRRSKGQRGWQAAGCLMRCRSTARTRTRDKHSQMTPSARAPVSSRTSATVALSLLGADTSTCVGSIAYVVAPHQVRPNGSPWTTGVSNIKWCCCLLQPVFMAHNAHVKGHDMKCDATAAMQQQQCNSSIQFISQWFLEKVSIQPATRKRYGQEHRI